MFLSQMNEEMEEAQVFARSGVLLSSNERNERGQVVSIRSSRPYARGHQTSLRAMVIDQMPLILDG